MSATAATVVSYDPLRDVRHLDARAARELGDWLSWLHVRNLRPRTISDYEWVAARLLRAYPEHRLEDFTPGDITNVLATFPSRGRRTKRAALASLFEWAFDHELIARDPMRRVPKIMREKQRVIDVFTDDEIERLTSLPENDGHLFLLLFDTGLRRAEARRLQVKHCLIDQALIVVVDGKGGQQRAVPMTGRLQRTLERWFRAEQLRPDDYLWPTRPGGYYLRRNSPIGNTSFTVWYRDCLNQARVRYRNPHTTRHSFATRWLRRGGRLETLSRAMGHASIRTTADLYAHLDLTDIARDLAIVEGA